MATRKSLAKMTADELLAHNLELREEIASLRERKRAIAAELDKRAVVERFGAMTDADKRALAQLLTADGIGSNETFGTPGA